jgi:hypothetical protein
MPVNLSPAAGAAAQFFTDNGVPLAGGLIYTYAAGTTTPQAAYTSSTGGTAWSNPIVLNSAGRVSGGGEIWLTGNLAYKFVLYDSTSVLIATYDQIRGVGDTTELLAFEALLAGSTGSSLVGFLQDGTGAIATTAQAKLRQTVSVFDFMTSAQIADAQANTGSLDVTTAFTNAQGTGNVTVMVPPGTYLLNELRIKTGVRLIGSGYQTTLFKQSVAASPAIYCLSDATTGFLSSVELSGFKVTGATLATVAAVIVAAYTTYVVWKSKFDFVAASSYRALEVQGATANNVFRCDFKVTSQDTTNTAVLVNGGTYNNFDLFLTNCNNGKALNFVGLACSFTSCTSDGQQYYAGSQTVINNATVEEWTGTGLAGEAAIVSQGFTETFINPLVILNATSAASISYAFEPFDNTVYVNPKILASTLANPFKASNAYKFVIVGPGQSTTTNKINSIFLDTSNTTQSLRRVSFVGDCSQWVTNNRPGGGKAIQYSAPVAAATVATLNNTDALVLEPAALLATLTIAMPNLPVDGQVLSISSTQVVTTLTVTAPTSGANVSLAPASLAANTPVSLVYYATGNKFYRI